MVRVSISIGLKDPDAIKRARVLLQQDKLRREFGKAFGRLGERVGREIQADLRGSKILRRRTGALARSITSQSFFTDSGAPAIRVGSIRGPIYARIQEEGGEILPKKAKALAIPLAPALTNAGVPKKPTREFNLKFVPFRKSGVAIGALYPPEELKKAQRRARAAKRPVTLRDAKAYFLLMRKVKLPARRWLARSFDDRLPGLVADLGRVVGEIMHARFQGRAK